MSKSLANRRLPKNLASKSKRDAARYRKGIEEGTSIAGWLIQTYADDSCLDCGGVFEWCVMDFDHRMEETKEFGVASWATRIATPERKKDIIKEIAKCDLVCSNCHRVRTWNRKNNDRT